MTESDDNGETEMVGDTVDTLGTVEPDNAEMYIQAGPLDVGFADGVSGGLRVLQDGTFLAISQGVDYPNGGRATVGHDLTPEEARNLAEILETAADNVEEAREQDTEASNDSSSFLRRLVGGGGR